MEIRYYDVSIEEIVETLRRALSGLPEVLVAILFGSATRRRFVRDIDVAVYFKSKPDLMDVIRLSGYLEDLIHIPVDVVPLRYSPPNLRLKALSEGVRLVVRDGGLLASLMAQALSECEDVEIKLRELRGR